MKFGWELSILFQIDWGWAQKWVVEAQLLEPLSAVETRPEVCG